MNDLTQRQVEILKALIEEYIATAEPVGSETLEKKYSLSASPATIRNEMAELEREGYIAQPHTSAGRIPTEKGYKFYLENYVAEGRIGDREKKEIRKVLNQDPVELSVKAAARKLAEFSNNAVIAAFSENNIYYSGLAHLLSQPQI